ncbi:MAG: hydrogenase iron-sulfur subunit [Deltaproteobacteria bacterium]|nr:hydrogenase iron-sulfur subunit [Deltaproteobacteria bacterium]
MDDKALNILVYHCRNLLLFENGGRKSFARSHPGLRLVAVPCSGKVEAHHLLKTLAGGAQGVLVLACAEKACQFLEGSYRSHKRFDYARSWLEELGIEPDRIRFAHMRPKDLGFLDSILEEFSQKLRTFGSFPPQQDPLTSFQNTGF